MSDLLVMASPKDHDNVAAHSRISVISSGQYKIHIIHGVYVNEDDGHDSSAPLVLMNANEIY